MAELFSALENGREERKGDAIGAWGGGASGLRPAGRRRLEKRLVVENRSQKMLIKGGVVRTGGVERVTDGEAGVGGGREGGRDQSVEFWGGDIGRVGGGGRGGGGWRGGVIGLVGNGRSKGALKNSQAAGKKVGRKTGGNTRAEGGTGVQGRGTGKRTPWLTKTESVGAERFGRQPWRY